MSTQKEPLGAEEVTRLGLPRVIWTSPAAQYRIVRVYDADNGAILTLVEHCDGYDLLGTRRWRQLDSTTYRAEGVPFATVARDWYHLACALIMAVASAEPAEEAGALDQAAEDRAQPAAELAEVVQEDEGRPYLACRSCGDVLGSAIDAHALIDRAHKAGWRTFVVWDGRHPQGAYALCPDCAPAEKGAES